MNKQATKQDLIKGMANRLAISHRAAAVIVKALGAELKQQLTQQRGVVINNVCVLKIKRIPSHAGSFKGERNNGVRLTATMSRNFKDEIKGINRTKDVDADTKSLRDLFYKYFGEEAFAN